MSKESFESGVAAQHPQEQLDRDINSKFVEVLAGASGDEETSRVIDGYNTTWKELLGQIKDAEIKEDEKRVAELEAEIYEVEKQKAMFLAQLSAMPKEDEPVLSELQAQMRAEAADDVIDETHELVRRNPPRALVAYLDKLGHSPVLELRQKASRKLRQAAVIAMALLGGLSGSKPVQAQSSVEKAQVTATTEDIPARMGSSLEQKKTSPFNVTNWAFHFNAMLEKDPDSKEIVKISPQAALFPVSFEVTRFTTEEGVASTDIPYEYARQFDLSPEARKNLNPGDYEKMEEAVKNDLSRRLVDQISGLSSNFWGEEGIAERRVRGIHGPEEEHEFKIKSIRITGHASPEGRDSSGAVTIRQGVVDAENIKLAAARASGGMDVLKEILIEKGVSNEEFDRLVAVSSVEDQFSDQEMVELSGLSQNEEGAADDEKILNLVKKYNAGKIEDAAVKSKLDEIIGSKRRVTFEIEYENESASRYAIPIPLFLLLLPALSRLRIPSWLKKRKGDTPKEPEPIKPIIFSPIRTPKPIIVTPIRTPIKPPKIEEVIEEPEKIEEPEEINVKVIETDKIPLLVEETLTWDEDSEEFRKNQIEANANDLWVFFDDEDAVRKGLDYRAICDGIIARYDDFGGDNPAKKREDYLTYTLLSVWRDHDLIGRQEAGWSKETINEGLDYENNPEQIKWARLHARSLLSLIEAKKTAPNLDYVEILEGRTKELLNESFANSLAEKRKGRSYRKV
ncbi:MAG TPA: hypothetical protein VJC12_01510 [Candidatus Paceibacterota bacterium]